MPGFSASNLRGVVLDRVERVVPDGELERDVFGAAGLTGDHALKRPRPRARALVSFCLPSVIAAKRRPSSVVPNVDRPPAGWSIGTASEPSAITFRPWRRQMRWEELSVPEIEALDRERTVLLPAARLGRAAWPPHAGRHRHDARRSLRSPQPTACAGARACCRRPGTASPQHHMRFAGTSRFARDHDGARRGHRRERGRARLPAPRAGQRPWRQ